MNTGEKIKLARRKAGLTQKELGEKLKVSQAMIGQYENGKRNPKLQTVRKIADALEINLFDLIDDFEQYSPEEIAQDFRERIKEGAEITKNAAESTASAISEMAKVGLALSDEAKETLLLHHYDKLNRSGKFEAIKRVEELTEIKKYTED